MLNTLIVGVEFLFPITVLVKLLYLSCNLLHFFFPFLGGGGKYSILVLVHC